MIIQDVTDYLETNGIGTQATDLFFGQMPNAPPAVTVVYEYAGEGPVNMAETRVPGIQILTRAATYTAGRTKIDAVYQLLKVIGDEFQDVAPSGVTINGTLYLKFAAVQEPFPLEVDDKGRHIFAQNFLVTYKE